MHRQQRQGNLTIELAVQTLVLQVFVRVGDAVEEGAGLFFAALDDYLQVL